MDRVYPGLGEHLKEETTVAIDGAIHETACYQPIRDGCEIFFIPKLGEGWASATTTAQCPELLYSVVGLRIVVVSLEHGSEIRPFSPSPTATDHWETM
jgi:hypothetical protein